jgi:hypothetical protein
VAETRRSDHELSEPTSQGSGDAAAKLAAVRGVLRAFDWERGDRQYALEEIERIVTAGDET